MEVALLVADGPRWYVTFQGLLGVLQFVIGLAMVAGYAIGVSGLFYRESRLPAPPSLNPGLAQPVACQGMRTSFPRTWPDWLMR